MNIKFRDLTAQDVEVRVAQVKEGKGCSLLLYKDARCDMNILDETVGAQNWQREHYECKGNLFCRVGILIDNVWIWKSDCGTESNTEAQKGEASDSFKRACFNWGIGRELYTAPFIWVKNGDVQLNGKKTYDKFRVTNIVIRDKRITALEIENTTLKKIVFAWKDGKDNSVPRTEAPQQNTLHETYPDAHQPIDPAQKEVYYKDKNKQLLRAIEQKSGADTHSLNAEYHRRIAALGDNGKSAFHVNAMLTTWLQELQQ